MKKKKKNGEKFFAKLKQKVLTWDNFTHPALHRKHTVFPVDHVPSASRLFMFQDKHLIFFFFAL